ncbi:hypothetical protein AGABI2DRAFT_122151 [Agaricus bisporus var. bisporus H97]|uniref:hypothetical protein n=1 Tax=Agaricus bisporus var. bisporus (strain H97 / ATCC MYA-4626 / FGSC 10389) TaxID=936046 RepID=UPI00029F55FA|nr:hypothetical protein AGABI2DRAFT_122151 [Agaricus bisporus var. bisporus H97]EKV43249.1 hypothetical protein AGABI2DRAFT_122151 [Agaricus bisporus var. bisporus H97]
MDIFSSAYKCAVQVSIASDKSIDLPLVSEENLKLCLGGIEGLSLNTKEIHRAFMANTPLEACQYQLLSNSNHLLKMANELEALSWRYHSAMTNQKVLVQSLGSSVTKCTQAD